MNHLKIMLAPFKWPAFIVFYLFVSMTAPLWLAAYLVYVVLHGAWKLVAEYVPWHAIARRVPWLRGWSERRAAAWERRKEVAYLRNMLYSAYLLTDHWQRTRWQKLEEAGHLCQQPGCGATRGLEVHHLTYERRGEERMTDLQVLCRRHHQEVHALRRRSTRRRRGGLIYEDSAGTF